MVIFKGLGRALRWIREERGLTQKEVAERAGVTPPMLSAYENGHTLPELETLDRLLVAGLSVSLGELIDALDIANGGPRASAPDTGGPNPAHGATRGVPSALTEGSAEVARGLLRISRFLYETGLDSGEPEADG